MEREHLEKIVSDIIKHNKDIKSLLSEQNMVLSNVMSSFNKENVDEAYLRGMHDVWEAAKKLTTFYGSKEFEKMGFKFGIYDAKNFYNIVSNYSAEEVIGIMKKYEEKEGVKEEEEIHIGDEVIALDGASLPYVVTDLLNDCVYGIGKNGEYWGCSRKESRFKKTGRYFPEVAELLNKMRSDD